MLYKPQIVYPYEETVSATDSSVAFSVLIDGTECVKYTINLYKNNAGTWSLAYTDTQTLVTSIKDQETLTFDVDFTNVALGAGNYYWNIVLYYDSTNYVISHNYFFYAHTPPTCSFVPAIPAIITTQSYNFICTYAQAEDVQIYWFEIRLLDDQNKIIDSSGIVKSSNIKYTFNALLSGQTYGVQCVGLTQRNVAFDTGIINFDVSCVVSSALAIPSAILQRDSSVLIDFGNIAQITGSITGVSAYIADFLYGGNIGLRLNAAAKCDFTVDIPSVFTVHSIWKPASALFTGDIIVLASTDGHSVKFGYSSSKFYVNIDDTVYNYSVEEVLTTDVYIVGLYSDGITVYPYFRRIV
jgi:hypothetical protein